MAFLSKPIFSFPNAAKTGFHRNRINSSSSSQNFSGIKKRKAAKFVMETTQKKLRSSEEGKTRTSPSSSILTGVKKPPRPQHIYVGRLSQHITTTKMEQYCATTDVDLLHIRQLSKLESWLQFFLCVFKFDVEKVESHNFWPQNLKISKFYLNNTAREWLSSVDQKWQETKSSLFSKNQLNFFSHNAFSSK